MFVAGGAVLRCLSERANPEAELDSQTDIDLFLHGLTEAAAVAKLHAILEHLSKITKQNGDIFRTKHSITFNATKPFRPVQVQTCVCCVLHSFRCRLCCGSIVILQRSSLVSTSTHAGLLSFCSVASPLSLVQLRF